MSPLLATTHAASRDLYKTFIKPSTLSLIHQCVMWTPSTLFRDTTHAVHQCSVFYLLMSFWSWALMNLKICSSGYRKVKVIPKPIILAYQEKNIYQKRSLNSGGSRISQRITPAGGADLLFGQFIPKTAWKWRHFGPEGIPLDPPLLKIHNFKPFFIFEPDCDCLCVWLMGLVYQLVWYSLSRLNFELLSASRVRVSRCI